MRHKIEEKEFIIPKDISWHFERIKKPDDKTVENYVLIQPGAPDVAKVLKAYAHHPVPAYNIVSIEIAYNEALNRQFLGNMQLMNKRKGNPKYVPSWRTKTIGEEKAWRETTYQKLQDFAADYSDPSLPNVMLLPLWHGTSDTVSGYILGGGYGIFSSNNPDVVTDEGYFGKGVYTAHEAEYAFRSYAQKHGDNAVLLLNWVSIYEAYPVIDGDMPKLKGKMGGFDQCDAHFIPVRSDLHPHTDIYLPCASGDDANYHEIVVFQYQQCLPRYRVKLIQNNPQPPFDDTATLYYQSALDSLSLGQYGQVANAWEDAAEAGHPGALIRLHWWHSGASGVYPENPQALAALQAVQATSIAELKQKANFRGDHDAEAQFTFAWAHQHGLGCEVDLAKAAKYYWVATQQGHRDAQYQLGVCCAAGIGVKQDISQAIHYYEQAAQQGHVHAHYVLAQCYEFGLGTPANPAKALEHKQAAQKGKHPQCIGSSIPLSLSTTPATTSPNSQLEQEMKQLEQQLEQHIVVLEEQVVLLKEQELLLTQRTAMLEQQLQQQQNKAVQDQQKIQELAQAVSLEQQASRSKDEWIARQKEEQKKKDEIIAKQTQEKAEKEAQLRDKDQLFQQWTETFQQMKQKAIDVSKELQRVQQESSQKDEVLKSKWFEMEQLKQELVASKEREQRLKQEFEAYKNRTQSPAPNVPTQTHPFSSIFSPASTSQPVLNSQQQERQNQLITACLTGDLGVIKQLKSQGASFSYPNQEGLYPLVAAVYGCSWEAVKYIESKLKGEAEKQWGQVDLNKAKAQFDRWMPTELSKNATYRELGQWYVKYQGASWCAYYDTECLKRHHYKNWGGWDGEYKDVTWEIGGKELWMESGARVRWNVKINNFYREEIESDIFDHLLNPSKTVHDDVVKTIREQLNALRNEVDTKVKRSSAAVFNPFL